MQNAVLMPLPTILKVQIRVRDSKEPRRTQPRRPKYWSMPHAYQGKMDVLVSSHAVRVSCATYTPSKTHFNRQSVLSSLNSKCVPAFIKIECLDLYPIKCLEHAGLYLACTWYLGTVVERD